MPRSGGWRALADGESAALTEELRRELSVGHVLAERELAAIARRGDRDDVLFLVDRTDLVVVHLTYRKETDSYWPSTTKLVSLVDESDD